MVRTLPALMLAALLAAPLAWAQPAPNANPNAFKGKLTPECQKLHDDYLKLQHSQGAERDDSRKGEGKEGGGERSGRAGTGGGNPELKAARADFQKRCGDLPADMQPGAQHADGDGKKDDGKPRNLAEALEGNRKESGQGAVTAAAATAGATAPSGQAAPAARAEPYVAPRKAGPNMGTGSSSARCAQLHQSLKDSLARKDACGKDKACKQNEQFGYEQLRSAYQSGCGELPADAKPRKK